jgi:hypothetical protein
MKLNFVVITLNGYVIERIQIGDYSKESVQDILDKLYGDEFTSKHIGEFVYIDDVAGNADDIDSFVQNRNNRKCEYRNETLPFSVSDRFYFETFHTDVVGYYSDFYVGLEIKTV